MHAEQTQAIAPVRETMMRVRQRFLSGLPDKVHAISIEVARATSGAGSLETLERLFHTIAGTGSTLGFVSLASLAREAEEICSAHSLDSESAAYLRMIAADLEKAVAAMSSHQTAA